MFPSRCQNLHRDGASLMAPSLSSQINARSSTNMSGATVTPTRTDTPLSAATFLLCEAASESSNAGHDAASNAASNPAPSQLSTALPNEIWGVIADFCARDVILNLRSVDSTLRFEADRTINNLVLTGSEQIRGFADSTGFTEIKNVSLRHGNSEDLLYLATALAAKPDCGPHLEIILALAHGCNAARNAEAFSVLSTLDLASLSIAFGEITVSDADALAQANFPINLRTGFTTESLLAAAQIQSLAVLRPLYGDFNDEVALAFSTHPALQSLLITTDSMLTSRGLEHLAQMSAICEMVLNCGSLRIDTSAARALAANNSLTALSLYKTMEFVDDEAAQAFSRSLSIQKLWVSSTAGVPHLCSMANLKELYLIGLRQPVSDTLRLTHEQGVALVQSAHVETLGVYVCDLDDDVLVHIARLNTLQTLRLRGIYIPLAAIEMLRVNTGLTALELSEVAFESPLEAGGLAMRDTLSVRHGEINYPNNASTLAGIAWLAAGRPEDQLEHYLRDVGSGIVFEDDPIKNRGLDVPLKDNGRDIHST